MKDDKWLSTLYVCLLTIAFIAIAMVAAQKAFALSPLPEGGWEMTKDDAGLPVALNRDDKKGVLFTFGYNKSKNCGDIKMIIGNIVPGKLEDITGEDIEVPSMMTTPATEVIPLPAIPVEFMEVDEDTVLMLYIYTPSDKLIFELMNAPIFTWRDPAFKEGHRATFNNEGFTEILTKVSQECVLFQEQRPTSTKDEQEGGFTA